MYAFPNLANMFSYSLLLVFFAYLVMIADNAFDFLPSFISAIVVLCETYLMALIGQSCQEAVSMYTGFQKGLNDFEF